MGFGAERANLMNEAPVSMDNAQSIQAEKDAGVQQNYEEAKGQVVDTRLTKEVE